jgi:CopG-like RHH_1 or ribbon-helix-helix domain, RHH_5
MPERKVKLLKTPREPQVTVSVYMPESLLEQINLLATIEGRATSPQILRLIKSGLSRRKRMVKS